MGAEPFNVSRDEKNVIIAAVPERAGPGRAGPSNPPHVFWKHAAVV